LARSFSMHGVQGAAARAVALAHAWFRHEDATSSVHDVSLDPRFQHRGVDLLWQRSDGRVLGVEVKGDRNGRHGNYFFELVSNVEKDTPGCFLYTEADLYVYALLDVREVHVLPMPAAREWFLPRASEWPLKHVHTRTGAILYTTVGAVVPVRTVQAEVPGALRFRVDGDGTLKPRRSYKKSPAAPGETGDGGDVPF
jgi:hypothetical protein